MSNTKTLSQEAQGLLIGTRQRASMIHHMLQAAQEMGVDLERLTDESIYKIGVATSAEEPGDEPGDFLHHMTKAGPFFELYEKEVVQVGPDLAIAHFHRCPLVDAWRDMGLSPERIDMLCHHASKGDFGRASNFRHAKLEFPKRIAAGDNICELYITRVE